MSKIGKGFSFLVECISEVRFDLQSSLTISNASSSHFTLKTMMYVSFIIPFVITYIWFAWKAINNNKITEAEMSSEEHKY